MNKFNSNETLNRMKSLMNYGLQTENKQAYSSVEYHKTGADNKEYAIVREGRNYFIKVAPKKNNVLKEDFQYIGGFKNRNDYKYDSFANAQKHFDLKMMSLKEAANRQDFSVSSWDLDKKENVVVEASDKMKKEILRERQIMSNAKAINEKKAICCDEPKCPKDNIKGCGDIKNGNAEDAVDHENPELPKEMTESVVNEEEVLGWNKNNKDYMDKSHGTEIGDSAPFDDSTARNIDDGDKKVTKTGEMKNGVVENHGTSMHDADSQDTPKVGVGEGPSDDNNKPFDSEKGKQIDEAVDGFDADGEDAIGDDAIGDDAIGDDAIGDDAIGDDAIDDDQIDDDVMDDEITDDELDDEEIADEDVYEDDLESRVEAIEDILTQIAQKLGVGEGLVDDDAYEDDDLYDDSDDDFGEEEPIEDSVDMDMPMEGRRRNDVQIIETRGYKNAMRKLRMNEEGMKPFKDAGRVPSGNMNKLNDFGRHPAYQKKVMELPPKDMSEFPGYYDMNDDSVRNDTPYGEKIGNGAPFEIDPMAIDNAISEAFNILKKKRNNKTA